MPREPFEGSVRVSATNTLTLLHRSSFVRDDMYIYLSTYQHICVYIYMLYIYIHRREREREREKKKEREREREKRERKGGPSVGHGIIAGPLLFPGG